MVPLEHNEEEHESTFSSQPLQVRAFFFFIGNTNTLVFPGQLIITTLKVNHLKGWHLSKYQIINLDGG